MISQWIFDLDGTISDPSSGMCASINSALQSVGVAPIPPEAVNQHIGPPLEATLGDLAGVSDAGIIDQLVVAYRTHYREEGFASNELYKGIPEVLETLKNQNITLGVCTAKTEPIARKILEHFGIVDYFSFVSGGDVGVMKGTQLAELSSRGLIDRSAIMIGDRKYDLVAAHENNIRSCAVLWGFGDRSELEKENPWVLLHQPQELPELVNYPDHSVGG